MSNKAIIVESPTKTRTLGRILGDEYKLLSSKGHVRDLPQDGLAVDIEHDFAPTYEIIPRQRKLVKQLQKDLDGVDIIYLASDPDREGEAIAWHLIHALNLPDNVKRLEFHEITKEAVSAALEDPRDIDNNLVDAQQARRILDRLVGYQISPLLWRKISGSSGTALSAGRVQSVALRLICEREREIAAFQPDEYWSITATLSPQDQPEATFEAEVKSRDDEQLIPEDKEQALLKNEKQAQAFVAELQEQQYRIAKITHTYPKRKPSPPFITSTLQLAAAGALHFPARKTMQIAQELYEGVEISGEATGLITYMRTDSTRVAPGAQQQAREYVEQRWGDEYVGAGQRGKKAKGAQEAHECIRPTSVLREPEKIASYLSKDQAALYELIWRQFVASQMKPAVYHRVTVDIPAGPYALRAIASRVKFPGFLAVQPDKKGEETTLPPLEEGQELSLLEMTPEQHFTQPPPRYNEGSLVAALEESGIGRPSTYAPIIETLRRRRYVRMQKRMFMPTRLGMTVTDWLLERFPGIMDVEFTAHVEEELDKVEQAKQNWVALLHEFYQGFEAQLQQAKDAPHKSLEGQKCPKCGGQLYERFSVSGKFAGCENYFDEAIKCDYTEDLLEDVLPRTEAEEIGEECPECGGQLLKRTTQWGSQFIGCSNYPKCKYTRNIGRDGKRKKQAVKTDMPCEKEDCDGHLVLRHGKRGPFLGCSNFPRCRFTRNATDDELARLQNEASDSTQGSE
ncbi:MAG: type I DNA topoisomerase [Armatimonadetes bacterium]|nr:type I DNA topoisomerase [Armatimonadota bacterium]